MKISPFIFLAVLCFLSISNVTAIEIPVTELHYVAHNVAPSGYLGDTDNLILVASDNDILSFDTIGGTTSVNQILNFPTDVNGIYVTKNWLYCILVDGRAYKIKTSISPREFSGLSFSGDSRDGYYLGDFSTGSTLYNNMILVDNNNDIFIYSATDEKIYKMDGSTYVFSDFLTSSDIASMTISTNRGRLSYILHNNAMYVACVDANNDLDVYLVTAPSTYSKLYDNAMLEASLTGTYIAVLTNDNFVLGTSHYTTTYSRIIEYNRTSSLGFIYDGTGYYSATSERGNLIVKPNGILCYAATTQDKVITLNTVTGAGGVYTDEDGTTPKEITYNYVNVNSEYDTYYNMSNINVKWSIAIDDDYIDTWTNTHSTPIQDTYKFRIELFSPDEVFVSYYDIPKTSWKYQTYTLGIFGSGDYVSSGYVGFSNIKGNGTWIIKLYEMNTITGGKAFIDADTFIILDQNNPSGTNTVPTDTNPSNIVSNFLESPYLIAIIIIGVVGFQFGRGRDGNINGTAMIVLIPLAVGLCCLMGILPMWILYVMVLCIIAFVAVKMSTGGS
jgi:hypothetical protein